MCVCGVCCIMLEYCPVLLVRVLVRVFGRVLVCTFLFIFLVLCSSALCMCGVCYNMLEYCPVQYLLVLVLVLVCTFLSIFLVLPVCMHVCMCV